MGSNRSEGVVHSAGSDRPDLGPATSLTSLSEPFSRTAELPETWVEGPGHVSVQYNRHVHTGNIPDNLTMEQMNLGHVEVMDHPVELWRKKVVVSDFDVVVGVNQSDGNQNDNQTLHKCNILDQEVCSVILVDDNRQLQVEFLCSIWVLVPVGRVPGVAA